MGNGESSYRRYLNGDDSAFSEVIDIYRESLIFFINRYVHNLSLAEEIAEDCFVALVVYPKRYSFKNSLKTYLFTIARNKAIDALRRQKHISHVPDEALDTISEEYEQFEKEIFKNEPQVKNLCAFLAKLLLMYFCLLWHLLFCSRFIG